MPPRPAAWKSQTTCRSGFGSLTGSSRVTAVDHRTSQDDPSPSLDPHYRASSATTRRSAPVPRIGTQPLADQPLGALPSTSDRRPEPRHWPPAGAGRQVPTFHTESPDQARAASMPDTTWPVSRHPPGSSRGTVTPPVSMSSEILSTRHQWFAYARLLGPHLTRSRRAFSATLSTPALDRRTLRWFAASPCRAAAEDHQPNGRPLHLRCSTASISPIFYIEPPVRFVLTLNRTSLSCCATRRTRSSALGALTPALCPGRVCCPRSPYPGLFPPPPPPPARRHCSTGSQVLQACPTAHARASRDYGLSLPRAARPAIIATGDRGLSRVSHMEIRCMLRFSDSAGSAGRSR